MSVIKFNSEYWLSQIQTTQEYMAKLVHGKRAGVKLTKSSGDTISFQDIDKEIQKCKSYIAYCQREYDNAIEEEGGTGSSRGKSILYFKSGYGV